MKDVQCYELFGGIALKNHAFSFHFHLCVYFLYSIKLKFHNNILQPFYMHIFVHVYIDRQTPLF